MEILYFRTNGHYGPYGQEFNLSADYSFHYDRESDQLLVQKLEGLPMGFFPVGDAHSAKVVNVTAFVGGNGSGKSTAIRALDQSLSIWGNRLLLNFVDLLVVRIHRSGSDAQYPAPGILWYKNPLGTCRESDFVHAGILGDESVRGLQIHEGNHLQLFKFTNSLYKSYPNNGENQIDLSTTHYLQSDWQDRNPSPQVSAQVLDTFRVNELERNIQYLADTSSHPIDFSLPVRVQVDVALSPILKLFFPNGQNEGEDETALSRAVRDGMTFHGTTPGIDLFLKRLYISALAAFLLDWELTIDYLEPIPSGIDSKTLCINTLEKAGVDPELVLHGHGGAQQVLDFLEYFSAWIEEDGSPIDIYTSAQVPFEIEQGSRFRTLWEKYKAAVWNTSFLDFKWRGLSDGEQNVLTLFSRFHDGIRRMNDRNEGLALANPPSNYLLLIDEGTESYHPEWQRKFLDSLMQHLPPMFGPGARLQIVLATHSPFIVSDLPNACINLLKKGEAPKHGVNLKDRYFGANVHSLFAHSFFMKSTIGEWAGRKINNLISYLQGQATDDIPDDATAQKWIDLVAEPILRNELQRMLDRGEISRLKRRLAELEGRTNGEGGDHA
jgi:ABC-type cobalamin/Fe3+-siderophores transport system ATPase subunit